MDNPSQNQPFAPDTQRAPRGTQSPTDQVPPLLTKKWLCIHFGLTSQAGKPNTHGLYSKVLTADVLHAAGLTERDVRRRDVRTFDRTTSRRLVEALGL